MCQNDIFYETTDETALTLVLILPNNCISFLFQANKAVRGAQRGGSTIVEEEEEL